MGAAACPPCSSRRAIARYHSGKWHIDGKVLDGGFDRSYLMQDAGRFFSPQNHQEDDQRLPRRAAMRATTQRPRSPITPSSICKNMPHSTASSRSLPMLPFCHRIFPLHAPQRRHHSLSRATTTPGWEQLRQSAGSAFSDLGLVRGQLSPVEREVGPPYLFPDAYEKLGPGEIQKPLPWSDLTAEQQEFQAMKMAIHAAMVDRMDQEIGRVVAQLEAMNALDNTLILFLSDNGASAEIMVRDEGHDRDCPPGSAATYLCLGPGWSTVANTPFRLHKTWVHEGGISTPLVAHWPQGIAARGELRTRPWACHRHRPDHSGCRRR